MKFVHAADLHLDSPLTGLDRYEGAPVHRIREATRRALEGLVDLCLTDQVELLLVAGDVYDGNWKDYSTGLYFAAQMARLREGGVRVVSIRGNHDAASQITRYLRLPDNVTELATTEPESVALEELGVVVHGQGFATRAVTDDLARAYPEPTPGMLNVGLLHTSLDGRPGHAPYAPTTLATLVAKGYEYWALGHVHAREVLSESPWVVFPGNLQGRHVKEAGAKGATVVEVAGGAVSAVRHAPLDVVRFGIHEVDVSEATDRYDAIDLCRDALLAATEAAEGRLCVARVRFVGRSAVHERLAGDPARAQADVRALVGDLGADALWVERVELATASAVDLDALGARDDAVGHVARIVRDVAQEDVAELLASDLAELRSRLPVEVRDGLGLEDGSLLAELRTSLCRTVLPRLVDAAGEE